MTAESIIEKSLIDQLTSGVSQWSYREDIKTEDSLWENLREKLNTANIRRLEGAPLTDSEMDMVKGYVRDQAINPYQAGKWLSGENGCVQIPLRREDASLGEISLVALDNNQIAGGSSCYEVINQYKFRGGTRHRRSDVTLLINGLPLIHIELKNENHPMDDAFYQIREYIRESHFTGLFGLVQMFVISNSSDTRYFAAAPYDRLSRKLLFPWLDENNQQVGKLKDFAREVLNIPQAHLMVCRYSVLDDKAQSVILLRPYQIHAINAVREASKRRESGFVWHTTGSGKTLTSYNVTRNLRNIPSVDKAVFLIDRKDLDEQTTSCFESYARITGDEISDTENTRELERLLKDSGKSLIITTVQKLSKLLDKYEHALSEYAKTKDEGTRRYRTAVALQKKHVVFVVDECHRAVSDEMKKRIDRFFNRTDKMALWYGFTGTPIFDSNKKPEKGDSARTTEAQYGKCLHRYTIKDALHDEAVLGFRVQNSGFSSDEVQSIAEQAGIEADKGGDADGRAELERQLVLKLGDRLYDTPEHRRSVIDYICNRSAGLFRLNAGNGEAFEAILTVSSIKIAQAYYREFKGFVTGGGVHEGIKKLLPDFPRFAITYSLIDDKEFSGVNQEMMAEAMDDYNKMFGTNFTLNEIGGYNRNLNDRLARKDSRYLNRKEQLDLVIVVDRLLTGFDAPCVSALFIDRRPMSPHGIIQAFSRTNRLFGQHKTYGNVVTFQTPALFKQAYDEALDLYCHGDSSYVMAPSFEQTKGALQKAAEELAGLLDRGIGELLINGATPEKELAEVVKRVQAYDRAAGAIVTYDEFHEGGNYERTVTDYLSDELGINISNEQMELLKGKYQNALEELRKRHSETDDIGIDDELDINYELDTIHDVTINYEYVMDLMQKHMSIRERNALYVIADNDVDGYIESLSRSNPQLREVVSGVWDDLRNNRLNMGELVRDIVNDRISAKIEGLICEFAGKWCVDPADLRYYVDDNAQSKLDLPGDYDAYREKGGEIQTKLKYRKALREAAQKFYEDQILPYKEH